MPAPEFLRQAISIHHAAQEMALEGFQFGKNNWGWPFDCAVESSEAYVKKLNDGKFLAVNSRESALRVDIANLSDADPGETAFLCLELPDKTLLFVRKDGEWAVFRDRDAARAFVKMPPREPAWLP
ncbi:MAG: hypothetical protein WCG66_02110 [bacterium]